MFTSLMIGSELCSNNLLESLVRRLNRMMKESKDHLIMILTTFYYYFELGCIYKNCYTYSSMHKNFNRVFSFNFLLVENLTIDIVCKRQEEKKVNKLKR